MLTQILGAIGFAAGGLVLLYTLAIVVDLRRSRGRGSAGQGAGVVILVLAVPVGLLVGGALTALGVLALHSTAWGQGAMRVLLAVLGLLGLLIAANRYVSELGYDKSEDLRHALILAGIALVPVALAIGLPYLVD